MASQLVDSVSPGIIIDEKMINKAIESPYGGLFDTLERIVLTAESRSDLPLSAAMGASASRKTGDVSTYGGPLSTHELAHLSLICAATLSPLLTGKEVKNQGFGSIDGDLLMALIPLLDHHVEAAASVDLIREASVHIDVQMPDLRDAHCQHLRAARHARDSSSQVSAAQSGSHRANS